MGHNTLIENRKKDAPHPVDVHVGERLRRLRLQSGLSQTALAQSAGVTFQQIQKYERGTNRISASKLMEFAQMLNTPVSSFFAGYDDAPEAPPVKQAEPHPFLATAEGNELARLFSKIPDQNRRRHVLALIHNLATEDADA